MEIDTSNMCSHLKRKLFEEDGQYHKIWLALQADNELTAIVRSRQLHIYRNGKKVLILAGKAAPKVLMEDRLTTLIGAQTKQGISLDDVIPQNVVCHTVYHGVTQCPQIHPRCNIRSKRYCLVVTILHICNSRLFLDGGTLPNVSDCITG